jgi:hypothetical protein
MAWEARVMKMIWPTILIGAILAGIIPAAEKAVDLSGTWVLDPAQNKTNQTTPRIREIRISGGIGSAPIPEENDSVDSGVELELGRVEDLTLQIVQTDSEVQIMRQFTTDSERKAVPQKFALDGSQCINIASDGRGEFVSRTSWKKGKLINSGTQTITIQGPRTEIYINEEYSISKNREKLTIKTMSTTSKGVTTLKQVFRKREKINSEIEK